MDAIFIDSGVFIALLVRSDDHHLRARELYTELVERRVPLVTTNHIVDETCTYLLYHYSTGHQLALRFGQFIREAPSMCLEEQARQKTEGGLIVLYASPAIEHAAWDISGRYETAGFSFTDCVSFAAMQALGIKKAFTFDKHYDTMGFTRL